MSSIPSRTMTATRLDPSYPCHGIAGSSIYVDGRCVICRQPSTSPAAMDVKRMATGVQVGVKIFIPLILPTNTLLPSYRRIISYRVISAEDESSPGGWIPCHREDWDAPEQSCLICGQSLGDPVSCLRLSGTESLLKKDCINFVFLPDPLEKFHSGTLIIGSLVKKYHLSWPIRVLSAIMIRQRIP
ncbi:hypothetical protein TSAR_000603 [Trichomalopsis sarcophagae]|uniref:Uncharacterized protein n=1 Tax=Trichomalopsis sarcophagae TaxID=543379 RepID=A0A232EPV3_9HYME|nr:hypothetical protein TSAR_000603 [Trichomalopsis sarcophagae]